MKYVSAFIHYVKTDKTKHDYMDYLRAIVIGLAITAIIRVFLDLVEHWRHEFFR